jgi:protoporphyrinogen oxidase
MENSQPGKIIILGAGVTGLTLAWELSKIYKNRVILLEKENYVGGLCATLSKDGFSFDLGSHRFHDMYLPQTWGLIKDICGDKILTRKRKGILYIKDFCLNYPPSVSNVVKMLGFKKSIVFLLSYLKAFLTRHINNSETAHTYESYSIREIGKLAYEKFYKPYGLKLWGIPPDRIVMEMAIRRVSRFQLSVIVQELINKLRRKEARFFYYPKDGIGYLAETLRHRFLENNGILHSSVQIDKIYTEGGRVGRINFTSANGISETIDVETIISTIPIEDLNNLVPLLSDEQHMPLLPLRWRSLRILYLITPDKVPCDTDTFYFPEPHLLIGRVSELNKFSPFLNKDSNNSFLTIEIPCTYNDEIWNMDDSVLMQRCVQELIKAKILKENLTRQPLFFSKRLKNVYPVYEIGWKENFRKIYNRLNTVSNLYMVGRHALFLHCNIDHCIIMADKLAKFLSGGATDKKQWDNIVAGFYHFRVRD